MAARPSRLARLLRGGAARTRAPRLPRTRARPRARAERLSVHAGAAQPPRAALRARSRGGRRSARRERQRPEGGPPRAPSRSEALRSRARGDSRVSAGHEARRRLEAVPSAARIDVKAAERAARDLLVALGADVDSDGLRETPRRVAAAYAEMLTPTEFNMTTFPNDAGYD